jgi:hypothetical protein
MNNQTLVISFPTPDGYTFFLLLTAAWVITVAIICLGKLDFPEDTRSWRWPFRLPFGRHLLVLYVFVLVYAGWTFANFGLEGH